MVKDEPSDVDAVNERPLEAWLRDAERNMAAKRESGESLQKAFDLTIGQLLDILKDAAEKAQNSGQEPPPDELAAPPENSDAGSASDEDVEDL